MGICEGGQILKSLTNLMKLYKILPFVYKTVLRLNAFPA